MIKTKIISPEEEYEIVKASIKNPQEFRLIYDLHYRAIFRFVNNRLNDVNIAAEIVSDVFYKAMTKLEKFQFRGTSIKNWILQIAFNELMMYFRKEKQTRIVSIEQEHIKELADDTETDSFLDIDKLGPALDSLADEDLALVEMKYFEKRSHREIAEILGITESNAKVKLHRALKQLRTNFK